MAAMPRETRLLHCRHCGEPLARVTSIGIYPRPDVVVYIEQGRLRLQCPCCGKRRWWSLKQAA